MKTLGQVAYEACSDGARQNFGPWENTIPLVRRVHEQMARGVASHIIVRLVREYQKEMDDNERFKMWGEIMEGYCTYCSSKLEGNETCHCVNDE